VKLKREHLWPWLVVVLVLVGAVCELRFQDRIWWCACGKANLWDGDIWCSHNSQHLFDPYSFTHILHGVLMAGLMGLALRRVSLLWQVSASVVLESLWEVLENSRFIIQRYREATIGLGYEGDSIANSLADILCCTVGFLLAKYLGFWRSLILFVVIELVLLFWVRDNLTLNMLCYSGPGGTGPVDGEGSTGSGDS
jgi:hypothetical protein